MSPHKRNLCAPKPLSDLTASGRSLIAKESDTDASDPDAWGESFYLLAIIYDPFGYLGPPPPREPMPILHVKTRRARRTERARILAQRLERGEGLWHPDDIDEDVLRKRAKKLAEG